MEQFGEFKSYSLVGGIVQLFKRGYWMIGTILFLFSVCFPYAKLLSILIATSSLVKLKTITRQRLHKLAKATGRYSILDLLVVAVMIVVIRFDKLLEVKAMSGTILFAIAVFLSIVAGLAVDLRPRETTT
jgi:paraquat-inducible protein A